MLFSMLEKSLSLPMEVLLQKSIWVSSILVVVILFEKFCIIHLQEFCASFLNEGAVAGFYVAHDLDFFTCSYYILSSPLPIDT